MGIVDLLKNYKYYSPGTKDDAYLREKPYLCSPIMGERLRIPVDWCGIAVSLAGHGGS